MSRKRWNELTYIHYNLRLRERQLERKSGDLISFDSFMIESILGDWLVEAEKQAIQENEVFIFLNAFFFQQVLSSLFFKSCKVPWILS